MDKALKQRLVGATILIALAVIFVPWWVGSPDQRVERGDTIDLPEPPATDREVRRLRLDEARQPRGESEASPDERRSEELPDPGTSSETEPDTEAETEPEIVELPDQPAAEVQEEVSEPSQETSRESPPETPVTEAPAPAGNGGDWLVQVASFSSAESAGELIGRLEALGYNAVTDTVIRGQARLHRVRAGPFPDRNDAEGAVNRIAGEIGGVQPTVVSVSGAPSGQDTAPSVGRYAVQVGVFAREENATQLRERLVGRGFTTFVDSETGGAHTTWKVRVGPVMEREEAERLRDRLQAEANVEGMIVTHP